MVAQGKTYTGYNDDITGYAKRFFIRLEKGW